MPAVRPSSPKARATLLGLFLCLLSAGPASAAEAPPAPAMPAEWTVASDLPVPPAQVQAMSARLGALLTGVRNTVYDVNGRRVQINTIVAPDAANAEKLMTRLRSMKSEEALLQKGLFIYEFVGKNDVLPAIAAGRKHLAAQ